MARYNSWQNSQLIPLLESLPVKELTKNRGAFFGSLLETANHLLWGDTMWMSRFDPSVEKPKADISGSAQIHPTVGSWAAERFRMDGKIRYWADSLRQLDMTNELSFYSSVLDRDVRAPLAPSIVHFFNHQTHHRGQIHAMLTAAGQTAPVSDLFLMPEDA
ncbi:DinB family protein [uncultured Roseobacter sp.]|uniref:DinB family protein n=1 Tax=uncultured Roseobacter sp. TaxID=114847 RepID=UPI00261CE05F|nr:DinB family protein [uncultured Roseobacter sp.]